MTTNDKQKDTRVPKDGKDLESRFSLNLGDSLETAKNTKEDLDARRHANEKFANKMFRGTKE